MTLVSQGLVFPARRRRPSRAQAIGDQPEEDFMREVQKFLKLWGWEFVFHVWDPTNAPAGFPDIVALRDGHGLALECKSQHGRVRPAQQQWVDEFDKIPGFFGQVVRPSDWAWIVRVAR